MYKLSEINEEFKRVLDLDKRFLDITDKFVLDQYFVPLNRAEEQEKATNAYNEKKPYNPCFEYKPLPPLSTMDLESFIEETQGKGYLTTLYHGAARELMGRILMLRHRDPLIVTRFSLEIWGKPTHQMIARAWYDLENTLTDSGTRSKQNEETFSAADVLPIFEARLKKFGIKWNCRLEPNMSSTAHCNVRLKEYTMRPDARYTRSRIQGLLVHEIDTHVFRCENGEIQPLKILARGLPANSALEEGLAMATEEQEGYLTHDSVRKIAGYVVGVNLALRASFSDVFYFLCKYFDPSRAFDMTQRIKRGWIDMSVPGSFTRDYVYYAGLQETRDFFSSHTCPKDRSLLYMGKIGIGDFPLMRELVNADLLRFPIYLPEWLQ